MKITIVACVLAVAAIAVGSSIGYGIVDNLPAIKSAFASVK